MESGEYCFLVSQVNMGAFGAGASGAARDSNKGHRNGFTGIGI